MTRGHWQLFLFGRPFSILHRITLILEIESRQIKTDLQRLVTRAQRWNQMISMRKVIWPKDDPELYAVLIKLLKDAYSTRAPYSAVFQVITDFHVLYRKMKFI